MDIAKLIGIVLIFVSLLPVSALTISYEISPEIVLPNGYVDCVITLRNTGVSPITIDSISFLSATIEFEPSHVQHVGNLSPGGSYTIKISMKSSAVGRQNAQMVVSTSEGSFSQIIELLVDDRFPEVSLSSPLYRGEVNYAKLFVATPVLIKNLRVEALFNATPKTFFVSELVGATSFQFRLGEELEFMNFKISFYNGRSYHEVERTIRVEYIPSKGVAISLQPSKDVLFIGEAVNLSVEITNMRNDDIYNVRIQLLGNGKFSQSEAKIDKISAGEKKTLNFIFSPRESGNTSIVARMSFEDFFGNKYEKSERLTLNVLESFVLQVINVQKVFSAGKTKISGEVVNYGHRSSLNTKVSAICDGEKADYYIGEIDAKDYETFDLEILCDNATLLLTWWNDAGDSFLVSEIVRIGKVEKKEENPIPLYITAIASALVLVFVGYVVYRARKK
ncbi:MAG: hypothetical protein QXJ58_00165 [Archaeoglobaceae archaeon]